jgi:hypothetical protein
LLAIGHKAFYDCDKLAVVTFRGFNAPILEEEYDVSYYSMLENLAMSGSLDLYGDGTHILHGLSIVPYYMWSATNATNIYYGANFVDYIGHLNNVKNGKDNRIVMVRPINGNYYDTFIFNQYFKTIVDGAAAADEVTLNAINLINNLPAPNVIALSDKAQVEAARAAFNLIMTTSQQALVESILPLLKEAEKRIETLEYLQNQNNNPVIPDEPDEPTIDKPVVDETDEGGIGTLAVVAIIIGAAILSGGIGVGVYFLILALNSKKATDVTEGTGNVTDDTDLKSAEDEGTDSENEENPSSEENI